MFVDLREVEDGTTIECDLCIVGSGAAGLTIADRLSGRGIDICVLESGGEELEPEIQDLYDGDIIGLDYFDLTTCRLRYFGGTTNHWAGFCMPYFPYEFEEFPWIEHSGWPIRYEEVVPYIRAAAEFLGFAEDDWEIGKWEERFGYRALPLDRRRFETAVHVIRPVRFAPLLRDRLRRAGDVTVYFHASVLELVPDAQVRRIEHLRIGTLDGKRFLVRPRRVVLAAGGIENARLLLLSDSRTPRGLGNDHDMVGRFFAEHPVFTVGTIVPAHPGVDVWFYDRHRVDGTRVAPFLVLAREAWARERITPVTFDLHPVTSTAPGVTALRGLKRNVVGPDGFDRLGERIGEILWDLTSVLGFAWDAVWYGQYPVERIDVTVAMVPAPNPDSRVVLGERRDAFGQPRVALDWRLTPLDKRSVRRATELLGAEIGRLGIGRLRSYVDDRDDTWPDDLEGANHHLCTTRMHDDPRRGVVDRDCRVHGIGNLYIAGSSVFTTPGIGTPTMMIVALAMRLADHLRETSP